MFAERLQERPLAVVPPCAAVCAFVCKKCLQLNFEHYGTIEGLGADWHVNNSPTHGERDMAAASDRRHRPLRSTQEPITQMSVDAAS